MAILTAATCRYAWEPNDKGNIVTRVAYYPSEDEDGEVRFKRLRTPFYRATLMNVTTDTRMLVRISLVPRTDLIRASITHPPTWERAKIKLGNGRIIDDVLSPKVERPGRKEVYEDLAKFRERIVSIAGEAMWGEFCKAWLDSM